jgi:hypothetical protein
MIIVVFLYFQDNQLTSLVGGGNICDLSMLQTLDLHSNSFVYLPGEIRHLRNLEVSTDFIFSIKCVNTGKEFCRNYVLK